MKVDENTARRPLPSGRYSGARGAIFVEAIIIIATLTLLFMGLVFFRLLYVNAAITSRLARGGTIAFAMSGCGSVSPKDWIGTDAKRYTVLPANSPSNDVVPTQETTQPQKSDKTADMADNLPGMTGGKSVLNPIGEGSVATNVTTSTGASLGRTKTVFKTHLEPRSYATCNDVVRPGSFDEVFGYVKGMFSNDVKVKKH
jgi:hypothetical protein